MSINATTSSVGTTTSSTPVSSSQNSEITQKSSTESSFKDEMKKVSTSEKKGEEAKDSIKKDEKTHTEKNNIADITQDVGNDIRTKALEQNNNETKNLTLLSISDVNTLLTNDIEQMIATAPTAVEDNKSIFNTDLGKDIKTLTLDFTNKLSITEDDAQFFVNLAQNDTVDTQAIIAQAQISLDNGAELSQVKQNVKISETLLNAIQTARETNQPLRIDFDQNISVILRMGKDGSFAANFIPGDKVVEQYLKNNIESLKSTFDEKELPYTDLSYSNRGSKRQKEERNNQQ